MSFIEENDQTATRREHLAAIRERVGNVYPNKFTRSIIVNPPAPDTITSVFEKFKHHALHSDDGARPTPEQLEAANRVLNEIKVALAGRLAVPPRVMGKAAFVHLSDGASRLQIYVRKDSTRVVTPNNKASKNEADNKDANNLDGWTLFNLLDHGDFIGVRGYLFVTKTGELSVHVDEFEFLAKALVPMPDKLHGISDPELRARRRYADLLAGSLKIEMETDALRDDKQSELTTREVFERRAKLIREMRRYLDERGYVEVETPMLVPVASGAAARPFVTHHNALDITLYARIAPELYLKRLLVGGFERVYELNRNFRNEGLSTRHNPEFTMLEFYAAYMDANGMMDFCEAMLKESLHKANGSLQVKYGENEIDFSAKFERRSMKEAIAFCFRNASPKTLTAEMLDEPKIVYCLEQNILEIERQPYILNIEQTEHGMDGWKRGHIVQTDYVNLCNKITVDDNELDRKETEKRIARIFELLCEGLFIGTIQQPTFIIDYPKSISPLSKASPENPNVAERFELFINGMECANGFSELNDPHEQYERFRDQMKERETGDDEAMMMDEDYIRALSYGMPPAAGIGIGIDRIVMLITNRRSIRDVILFPHMRPQEAKQEETSET